MLLWQVACKKRSVLQGQHQLLNPGLHFVSSGLQFLLLGNALLTPTNLTTPCLVTY